MKIIRNILIVLYALIAIAVTICLLSYNNYKVTEFGEQSLLIIDNNKLEPNYKNGDLVIVNGKDKTEVGDEVFFYNTYENDMSISLAKITKAEKVTSTETTYTLEGDHEISSEYVIGASKTATTIGVLGTILGILESKWGFLLLIVLPSLLAFLYEIVEIITEIRKEPKKETAKEEKKESK